jgi:hypothetical protein
MRLPPVCTFRVKRKVMQTDEKSVAVPSGLDAALSAITGPAKMNTVTKSSLDWDTFKDGSGMADELEQAAKDGFLAKKEFLERCDVRQFEKERDLRLEGRGK